MRTETECVRGGKECKHLGSGNIAALLTPDSEFCEFCRFCGDVYGQDNYQKR